MTTERFTIKDFEHAKVSRWVTRVPGWQRRLGETLVKLFEMGESVKFCRVCNKLEGVFIVKHGKKENKGRIFKKCPTETCNSFVWLT